MEGSSSSRSRRDTLSLFQHGWNWRSETLPLEKPGIRKEKTDRSTTRKASTGASTHHTVPWPFHGPTSSSVVESEFAPLSPIPLLKRSRPGTAGSAAGSTAGSTIGSIVPDYVRNYIRGETPETVALRRQTRIMLGGRNGEPYGETAFPHKRSLTGLAIPTLAMPHPALLNQNGNPGSPTLSDFHVNIQSSVNSRFSIENDEEGMLDARSGGGIFHSPICGASWARRIRASGWRFGMAVNALISFLILVAVLLGLVLALALSARNHSGDKADFAVFSGACQTADHVSWGLFAAVSACCMTMIAGANYAFQVLSSPTREEVDRAHRLGRWMDLGIPSARNLEGIAGWRAAIVVFVLLAAVSAQVIFNSTILVSRSATAENILFVTPGFLAGAPFSNSSANLANLTSLDLIPLQRIASQPLALTNMSSRVCLETFSDPLQADYQSLFVIVQDADDEQNSLLGTLPSGTTISSYSDGKGGMLFAGQSVSSCFASKADIELDAPSCRITLNVPLLGAAALASLIPTAMMIIATRSRFEPLVSLGDALASFLSKPDHTTDGVSLLSKKEVRQSRWQPNEPRYWVPRRLLWMQTVSIRRWILWLATWTIPAALAAAGVSLVLARNPSTPYGLRRDSLAPANLLLVAPVSSRTVLSLIASLPHMLLAVLYLTSNAHLTAYFLSHELSQFAAAAVPPPGREKSPRTRLRVTSGRVHGKQTKSFYLTLPRLFSWLLMLIFAGGSFFLSQALVVVATMDLSRDPASSSSYPSNTISALAILPTALVGLLGLLVADAALVVGLGLRPVAPVSVNESGVSAANPLALRGGTCSAIISARAHTLPEESGRGIERERIAWGVIKEDGMYNNQAGFTALAAGPLKAGRQYF